MADRTQQGRDHPACVSPVIGAFMRSWNDRLDRAARPNPRSRTMSNPAPETIIREAIAISSCDPDGACPSVCGSVPPIDNCLRHQAISAVRQLVRERDEARAEINRLRHHLDVMWAEVIALAAAQEPPAYTPAPECPRCGLFLAPGEVHGEHEVGCVAQEPPAEDGAA